MKMNSANLIWATPNGDNLLGYIARVSNPKATPEDPSEKLIKYLIKHRHWSPFEMVSACVEIHTTRDISRQLLRHRSFSFQEFSGRYAEYENVGENLREARLQDHKNRQNSLPCEDAEVEQRWKAAQQAVVELSNRVYRESLDELGIAKEQARAILPEGLVPTKVYMVGSLRSWIHYWDVRRDPATQKEHRLVADSTYSAVISKFPSVLGALNEEVY